MDIEQLRKDIKMYIEEAKKYEDDKKYAEAQRFYLKAATNINILKINKSFPELKKIII